MLNDAGSFIELFGSTNLMSMRGLISLFIWLKIYFCLI